MEEWKEYKLGGITSKIGSGATPKGGKESYLGGNIALIRSQNILDFAFTNSGLVYINKDQASKLNNVEVKENDILLNITGDSVARVCIVPQKILPARVNQHVAIIRGNDIVDNRYLLYYLQYIKPYLLSLSQGGATRNALTKKMLEDLDIKVPSKNVQNIIISVLSSLDDKIELNRRINENLEQQAQALFKSWFVDFEPFKDGLFVDSELGKIPEELTITHIGDIPHTIESGRRPKGGAVLNGVPSIGAENIKGLGYYDYSKTKYIPEDFALTTNRGKINGYELLIYKDGGKPGYFIPNYTIFGEGFPFDEMFINEHVFRLDLMSKGYNVFAYFYMQTPYIMNQLNSIGGKAAIPGINTKDVESLPIFTENNKKIKEFGNLVLPMITTILRNCHENARLAQLRDTLLPHLMSGELKISDIKNKKLQD